MKLIIRKNHFEASVWAALYICDKINAHFKENEKPFVLGLPTGDSPLLIYKELIKLYIEKKISFANVHTFNMDEYAGLTSDHPQSYHFFMNENFFKHIDIDPVNTHILNGMAQDTEKECSLYEEMILKKGPIDLFLGGMGSNGHIAFNEPGSSFNSRTRLIRLNEETRVANSRFFNGDISKVPSAALTVGIGTIMDAREILIIINGKHKAMALKESLEGGVNIRMPLSCLHNHPNATIVCDEDAACELSNNTAENDD